MPTLLHDRHSTVFSYPAETQVINETYQSTRPSFKAQVSLSARLGETPLDEFGISQR